MTKQPKTHWNYRVVRRHNKHGSWLEITEVYYTNGKPWAFASDLTAPHVSGDDLEDDERRLNDLRLTLNRMKEALSKPILDENEDFRE